MESLIVSPLIQLVFDKLTCQILSKLQSRPGFKKEMKKLQDKLPLIQAVIEDAEERQHKDKKIKIWLEKLKDVAYDADDLLDEISSQILRSHSKKNNLQMRQFPFEDHVVDELHAHYLKMSSNLKEIKDKVCYLTLESIPSYFRLSHKLKEIRERLDDIAGEIGNFQLKEVVVYRETDDISEERRETGPHVDDSGVFGRKKDVEKIVDMLLSPKTNASWVIPIVGIGGMGKTTLAQLVYNDERVTRFFDLKMWVSVNDNFSPRKVVTAMLDYATKWKYCDSISQMGFLQSQLKEALCGRRYLLVLDDVWNDDPEEWDKVKNLLGGGADGSKVIVTSRSQKVASIMSTAPPYHLEALTKDDCWLLFKQRAFADGEEVFPNLLPIGKQIVDKCKGVPLAAKVLGSLMRFKREESEWLRVQRNELWNLDGGESRILCVLKLSFNHLPSHLKRCFAYCAMFPKNYEIHKEKLILQWIAEGLIQNSPYSYPDYLESTLEDVGNDYFNDLLRMSFLEKVNECDDSRMEEYKMHDLIHDLAKFVAGNEFMTVGKTNCQRSLTQSQSMPGVCNSYARARHAVVDCSFSSNLIPEPLWEAKKLRTLHLLSFGDVSEKAIKNLISGFKYLRILNLSGLGVEKLHKSIGNLNCLRYLDLSNTPIENLPTTICHLYKLQTLDLSGCSNLQELPKGMKQMIDLRHLNIKDCSRLTHLPAFIGNLGNLQTLPIFLVGQTLADNLSQLMHLHDLRGELKIKHLENVTTDHLFDMERITLYYPSLLTRVESMQLHSLELSWGYVDESKWNPYIQRQTRQMGHNADAEPDTVISLLQPNSSIRRLSINGYEGTQFPSWMNLETLSNLKKLELINCPKCESLPTIGELPSLKFLHIQGMDSVLTIDSKFYGTGITSFSSLKELSLLDCPNLKVWKRIDPGEAFACLKKLTVINCPLLISMPFFPSLQQLEMRNCNPLLLRSAAELHFLSILVINNFPELNFIPKALLSDKPLLLSLTVCSCPKLCSIPTNFRELRALKSLRIGWCQELETLLHELTNLTSLETLEIIECPRLGSLPTASIEGLSSLRSLSIENCNGFTSLPIAMQHSTALERLTIMYCSNLASLPDDLQHLSMLKSLTILSCTELASLPEGLQFVTTLQNLEIHSCPKFMELPEWMGNLTSLRSLAISDCINLKSLPEGLQHLSALQHLSIRDCLDLENQCKMGNGDDWKKISHVPYAYVGSSALQQQQRRNFASSSSVP